MGHPVVERRLAIDEVFEAAERGDVLEAFGTGTAAVVSPVGLLRWGGREVALSGGRIGALTQRLYDTLTGIQLGALPDSHGWVEIV
jgi:branched-chain amino acid aminotransferase